MSDIVRRISHPNLQELEKTNPGYIFSTFKGQRKFHPDPYASYFIDAIEDNSEVFIGNIPKTIYEDQLVPLFKTIGKIHSFRLMLDFEGRTRGYAFVQYFTANNARRAVDLLNGYEIRRNAKLAVYISIDNRRLFVGNLPLTMNKTDLFHLIGPKVNELSEVILYPRDDSSGLNRGFAFLQFNSHADASIARRTLQSAPIEFDGKMLRIDWANPIPTMSTAETAKIDVLYAKNVPRNYTDIQLLTWIENKVGNGQILRVHRINNYAFIHCIDHETAELTMDNLQGFELEGEYLEIEWARPPGFANQQNFCKSVSLKGRREIQMRRRANSSAID